MKFLFSLLFTTLSLSTLMAQRYYPSGLQSRHRVSIGTGLSDYFGDLKSRRSVAGNMNFSLSYEYQLREHIALRADAAVYRLSASDANATAVSSWRHARNLSFYSTNAELSSSFVFFLFPQIPATYTNRQMFNVYALAGVGLTYFDPRTTYEGVSYRLRDYQTEGVEYGKFSPVIPMGLGLQARISPQFDLAMEIVYRATFTDYLDDVSNRYVDHGEPGPHNMASLLADRGHEFGHPPKAPGSQRGNPKNNDGYAFYNIRLIYYINSLYYKANDPRKKPNRL